MDCILLHGHYKRRGRGIGMMSMYKKVVLRKKNGDLIKGNIDLFNATNPSVVLNDISGTIHSVALDELKAIFFVKDLFVDKRFHGDYCTFDNCKERHGRRVVVHFFDGEEIWGTILGINKKKQGFFLTPSDPRSNNVSVFAPFRSVKKIDFVDENKPL